MKQTLYQDSYQQVQAGATLNVPFAGLSTPLVYIGDILSETLFDVIDVVGKRVAARRRQRAIDRNIAILADLEDSVLDDIGIKRYQIAGAAEFIVDHPGSDRYRYLT